MDNRKASSLSLGLQKLQELKLVGTGETSPSFTVEPEFALILQRLA